MTLILSTQRDSFALLAGEQLLGSPGGSVVYRPKVVCHSHLPLAFAYGGSAFLRLNGKDAETTQHLQEFANEIVSSNELFLPLLAKRLDERFRPGIEDIKLATQVVIAIVRNNRARVGAQCFNFDFTRGQATTDFCEQCVRIVPPMIESAYQQQDWEYLHDQMITDTGSIAHRARVLVQKGINYDAHLNGGQNKWCGGNVDVVLVSAAGASPV